LKAIWSSSKDIVSRALFNNWSQDQNTCQISSENISIDTTGKYIIISDFEETNQKLLIKVYNQGLELIKTVNWKLAHKNYDFELSVSDSFIIVHELIMGTIFILSLCTWTRVPIDFPCEIKRQALWDQTSLFLDFANNLSKINLWTKETQLFKLESFIDATEIKCNEKHVIVYDSFFNKLYIYDLSDNDNITDCKKPVLELDTINMIDFEITYNSQVILMWNKDLSVEVSMHQVGQEMIRLTTNKPIESSPNILVNSDFCLIVFHEGTYSTYFFFKYCDLNHNELSPYIKNVANLNPKSWTLGVTKTSLVKIERNTIECIKFWTC